MISLLLPELLALMGVHLSLSTITGIETGIQLLEWLEANHPEVLDTVKKIYNQLFPSAPVDASLLGSFSLKIFLPHKWTLEQEASFAKRMSDVGQSGGA